MNKNLDTILHNIYGLDPSLKDRDADVRAVVVALLDARPTLAIDPQFIQDLRMRVLSSKKIPTIVSPYVENLRWWLVRSLPVGVAVVLLIVLLPSTQNGTLPKEPVLLPIEMASEITQEGDADGTSLFSGQAPENVSQDRMMKMGTGDRVAVEVLPVNTNTRFVQIVATFIEPSFAIVYDPANFSIIGTSTVAVGAMIDLQIPLVRGLREKEGLVVRVAIDDGDGLFDPRRDHLFVGNDGEVFGYAFLVEPEYRLE